MLTDQDIQKIIKAEAGVFVTKEEFSVMREEIREEFSNLVTAVDAYAKKADSFFQELLVVAHRLDRHEKWIHQIAEKLGVKLEY